MLRLCGFDIELIIEEVFDRGEWPNLCRGCDPGRQWLVVQTDDDPLHLEWMCAPASEGAIRAIREGRCAPEDVLCHSATGTVEVVTVDNGRAVPDRCLVNGQIWEHLALFRDRPVAAAA
jgi:hypothetical protein